MGDPMGGMGAPPPGGPGMDPMGMGGMPRASFHLYFASKSNIRFPAMPGDPMGAPGGVPGAPPPF